MHLLYITGNFPKISETFISNQLIWFKENGLHFKILAQTPDEIILHENIIESGILDAVFYVKGIPNSHIGKIMFFVKSILHLSFKGKIDVLYYILKQTNPKILLETLYYLPKKNVDQKYTITHAHFIINGFRAIFLNKLGLINTEKIVVNVHGLDLHKYFKGLKKYIREYLIENVDMFIVNSTYTGEHLQMLGCPACKITKIPVGLDFEDYYIALDETQESKHEGKIHFLTVGRLVEKKGIDLSLEALHKLNSSIDFKWEYRIVGTGPLMEKLKKMTNKFELENKVVFLGQLTREEVKDQYKWADIFLLTSKEAVNGDKEGQGLVLQEAQAAGIPVIASNHNGFPDSIVHGETGLLVKEDDLKSTVDGLNEMLSRRDKWARMGSNGQQFVKENFDFMVVNEKLLDLYRSLS